MVEEIKNPPQRDPEEVGRAIAGEAAEFDKNNISARMMLMSWEFWAMVTAAIQGVEPTKPNPEPTPEPTPEPVTEPVTQPASGSFDF